MCEKKATDIVTGSLYMRRKEAANLTHLLVECNSLVTWRRMIFHL